VARKLKHSQDDQFMGVQEQVKAMQTSIKQTQEQAQAHAKTMQKEVHDQFKGVQEQAKAMQTDLDRPY
jgi:gas vesicle protein